MRTFEQHLFFFVTMHYVTILFKKMHYINQAKFDPLLPCLVYPMTRLCAERIFMICTGEAFLPIYVVHLQDKATAQEFSLINL